MTPQTPTERERRKLTEMEIRVARAMLENVEATGGIERFVERFMNYPESELTALAKTSIRAMREPTADMTKSPSDGTVGPTDMDVAGQMWLSEEQKALLWQAMIDAASPSNTEGVK